MTDWEAIAAGRWTRSTGRGVVVHCPTWPRCTHSEAVEKGGVTRSHRLALLAMQEHFETCPGVAALAAED